MGADSSKTAILPKLMARTGIYIKQKNHPYPSIDHDGGIAPKFCMFHRG